MTETITLKSFAELAALFPDENEGASEDAVSDSALPSGSPSTDDADLARLVADLESAGVALARIIVRDQEDRALALRDLERYDAQVRRQRDAELAREQARRIRQEAEAFRARAFGHEARQEAERIAEAAGKAEEFARRRVEAASHDIEQLAAEIDLERLLSERKKAREAEKAKAAAAERAERLSGALNRAKEALDAGRVGEAREMLDQVSTENPNNPEIASLIAIITQKELDVKVAVVEDVLREARRELRRDPAGVIARFEALDVNHLPDALARQIFGAWAQACSRLCKDRGIAEPLRYAPNPGRGAVIARETAEGAYVVVSAMGMGPSWSVGKTVDERQVRRARPLR